MASKDIEFRVGVIILIGLLAMAGALYWLQGYRLEMNTRSVTVLFDDVGTLSAGDKVTVSGVDKGKVTTLVLTGDGVEVHLLLGTDVQLKSDAQFVIKNLGLMGERFIAISPGQSDRPLDYSIPVVGHYDAGLPEVMGLMGEMITELRNLVFVFRRHVGSDTTLKRLNQTIANFEKLSALAVDYLARNEQKLDETADNFLSSSRTLKTMLADNAPRIDSTVARFERTSANMERVILRLDTLSHSLQEFAVNVNNSDGTLGLLLEDRRLYDDLRRTADNVDDLIADIRANPRKYINLKIELF